MIILFLVVACAVTFGLVASSLTSMSRVTATDTMTRGRWGVLEWDFRRDRRLDAHERRWQASLISGRDQPTRWPVLVAEIAVLERAADVQSDPNPPAAFDAEWIAGRLTRLEQRPSHPTTDTEDQHQ